MPDCAFSLAFLAIDNSFASACHERGTSRMVDESIDAVAGGCRRFRTAARIKNSSLRGYITREII